MEDNNVTPENPEIEIAGEEKKSPNKFFGTWKYGLVIALLGLGLCVLEGFQRPTGIIILVLGIFRVVYGLYNES